MRRMIMVIVVVVTGGLFMGRARAQSQDCQSVTNLSAQSQVQIATAAHSDALDSNACAFEVDPVTDVAHMSLTVTAGKTYYVSFQGWAGQIANISARGANPGDVDLRLQVIGPDGSPLAFGQRETTTGAPLPSFEIREDGTYILALSSADGRGGEDISISLATHWRRGPGIR